MIEWSKLEQYGGTQHRSFEELCYQIAKGLYEHEGRFTSIDDSGGGDGVEFYLTFPDGRQWGWQSKFYYPNGRLSVSNRKASIEKSLQKACQEHPQLEKWFLCLPTNLTPDDQDWFDSKLTESTVNSRPTVPDGHSVKLELWGESDFIGWMSEERFAGMRHYFFGELELTTEWFRRQFEKQVEGVRDRFEASLHTETYVDASVHALLGDGAFAERLDQLLVNLRESLGKHQERLSDLRSVRPRSIDWGTCNNELIPAAQRLQETLVEIMAELGWARDMVADKRLDLVREGEWDSILKRGYDALNTYRKHSQAVDVHALPYTGAKEQEEYDRDEAARVLRGPDWSAANFLDDARQLAFLLQEIKKPDLHVFGDAGFGKTHLACHVCQERIENNFPAIFLSGASFIEDRPLEEQLRAILDVPPAYGWHDFLRALDTAAQAHRTRIPIVIDGLNEAVEDGAFSRVWQRDLPRFIREIAGLENVVLITTCRSSYRDRIWPGEGPENVEHAYGFVGGGVEEAVRKYFHAYKITADLTAAPLSQFGHPIYLKIFCETKNPDRRETRHVYAGQLTLFELFDGYLERCNRVVCERLGLHPSARVASRSLERVASYLWENRVRRIPLSVTVELIDEQPLARLEWETSHTRAIESESLLVNRDWGDGEEEFFFTYDLMGGYLIARRLIDENADDLVGFLNAKETATLLYEDDYSERHPLQEDIRRCIAASLPAQVGHYLHELTDNRKAFSDSVEALFEIAPESVDESCVTLVSELFARERNRKRLLEKATSTVGHVQHPLNAEFWDARLAELPMPERDLSWTEYVRYHAEEFGDALEQFEERCKREPAFLDLDAARMHLLARHFMWVLASTVRLLRDRATRALYSYGRRFPEHFFALVQDAFEVDDPYISERMLAACYGVAMARRYDPADREFVGDTLLGWAELLYAAMFAPGAPHATTHILARNYARRTIEIASIHYPDVLGEEELERTKPPYEDGGIREWGESEDKNEGEYRNNHPFNPLDDDPMGKLGPQISKYHSGERAYKEARAKLWWRVYNLGYSFERFSSVDAQISSEAVMLLQYYNGEGRGEGYGRKYVHIATCELAGYRDDLGLLRRDYDYEINPPHVDLDPSFPEKPPELQLIPGDLLGDRREPLGEWIAHGPDLTFEEVLEIEEIQGQHGPWVLLYGHITQHDEQSRRYMGCFMQGVLLNAADAEKILDAWDRAEKSHLDATDIADSQQNHYTYAGEIPWCETYPPNEPSDVSLVMGIKTVVRKSPEIRFVRNGEPIGDAEFAELMARYFGDEDTCTEPREAQGTIDDLQSALEAEGIELVEEEISVDVQQPDIVDLEMTMPVNRHSWAGRHSDVTPGFTAYVPARQFADRLRLTNRPQTYDLFDQEGRRASVTFEHGGEFSNMQKFAYIRKDLLDCYLEGSGQRLAWAKYGERALYHAGMGGEEEEKELLGGSSPYVRYEKTCLYD